MSELIVPGQANPQSSDLLLGPNSKSDEEIADLLKPADGSKPPPGLDLWDLVGQYQQNGSLPDKTAPDYVERNTSADLVNSGLLTLINLMCFVPAGLLLTALKDRVSGILVGWSLVPYEGNVWTDEEVKQARTGVEQRWPGLERLLVEHHNLGSRIHVVPVDETQSEAGATQEEINQAKGLNPPTSGERKVEVDVYGNPSTFIEVAGEETLLCVDCNLVPIVGNLLDFEPVDVSEGGGFLCPGCHQERERLLAEGLEADYQSKIAKANPI